ncbi:hypothetical protein HDU93_007888 [Gonapodya sp. JEL0774]|nr:hypothetical protein HDU93_007888 [Gonapodya sp. JEL0774]
MAIGVGDKANTYALDAYENAIQRWDSSVSPNGTRGRDLRLRIEHAQFVRAHDVERFVRGGIIPSVQPTHATSDMSYAELRMGANRVANTGYLWKTFLEKGARALALGSDFPVENFDPLLGFYAAVTRLDTKGGSPHGTSGWNPREILTREDALKGFTLDAAYASFQENDIGSIVVGKQGDFVVWSDNIMTINRADILRVKPIATVVGGIVEHGQLE